MVRGRVKSFAFNADEETVRFVRVSMEVESCSISPPFDEDCSSVCRIVDKAEWSRSSS